MNSVHILPLKDAYIKFSHHYTCILNHKHSALEGIASVLLAVHQRGIQGRQVISNCCGEACGVKVSRQSGSVHSTHSVQSALYCKSLLINLMPLAELHSRLESVTKKKEKQSQNMLLTVETVLEHRIRTFFISWFLFTVVDL